MKFELLATLSEAGAPPGREDHVASVVRQTLSERVDAVTTDDLGNVIGTANPGGDRTIGIVAHMDEIGLLVREITDDGFLKVDSIGGWDARVLLGQRVRVHATEDPFTGVVATHSRFEEGTGELAVRDLYVDPCLGAEETHGRVGVGDPISVEQPIVRHEIGTDGWAVVSGKAMDNRACLYAMLEAAENVDDVAPTVRFVGTTQEEVGRRGAESFAAGAEFDELVVLDIAPASDTPVRENGVLTLGDGPAVQLMDADALPDVNVSNRLLTCAAREDVPIQRDVSGGISTEAGVFQRVGGATPVGMLSLPVRYYHSPVECVHEGDVDGLVSTLRAYLNDQHS